MSDCDNLIDKELFLEKFEKLSLKVEQLTSEFSKLKEKLDKSNKINRSFGLEAIRNSQPLSFTKEVYGIQSPDKRYILSIRSVSEQWHGRKNDYLLVIRQQERETHMDIKALGIRIPIDDIKSLESLAKQVLSLLYASCELEGLEFNDILRELLTQINEERAKMVQEVKDRMILSK